MSSSGSHTGTKVPNTGRTGGTIVGNSASRRLYGTYDCSSDEHESAGRLNGEILNGHTHDVDAHATDLRRMGRGGKGQITSSGGSNRSSSPQSDANCQHSQQHVAAQTKRESRGR